MMPFEEGYRAGQQGCDPRECPHPKMTDEWNEWQRGHGFAVDLARIATEQQAILG